MSASRRGACCAIAAVLMLVAAACESDARCSTNAECETGEVCSNEKNPRGDGVCINPCVRHPNAPACIDASVAVDASTVDAGIDAAMAGANP